MVLVKGASVAGLPTVSRGLGFGPTTPSDPQKSQGEPAVTADKAGTVYTCGTYGASNGTDHASVSLDGGKTFRTLGVPPTGTLGTAQGGGDCALATSPVKNSQGDYTLAYAGLGPLTNFSTASSMDGGRSFSASPTQHQAGHHCRCRPAMARVRGRQDRLLQLQLVPRSGGQIVQKSVDGGLTYDSPAVVAATDGDARPDPSRAAGAHRPGSPIVYFPYDNGNKVKLALSNDGGHDLQPVRRCRRAGFADCRFPRRRPRRVGNIYVTWAEKGGGRDIYFSALRAESRRAAAAAPAAPNNPGSPGEPVRVNRGGIETTVMPWIAAGGGPGRMAIAFYGTKTVGDPDSGAFKASGTCTSTQTLNAFAQTPTFDQTKVTTHPFHYDSICLGGLGCDIAQR